MMEEMVLRLRPQSISSESFAILGQDADLGGGHCRGLQKDRCVIEEHTDAKVEDLFVEEVVFTAFPLLR